jgi:hypothetical protein
MAADGVPLTREAEPISTSELITVLRFYVNSCSMPLQGPISGAVNFVRRSDALAALDALVARFAELEQERDEEHDPWLPAPCTCGAAANRLHLQTGLCSRPGRCCCTRGGGDAVTRFGTTYTETEAILYAVEDYDADSGNHEPLDRYIVENMTPRERRHLAGAAAVLVARCWELRDSLIEEAVPAAAAVPEEEETL